MLGKLEDVKQGFDPMIGGTKYRISVGWNITSKLTGMDFCFIS